MNKSVRLLIHAINKNTALEINLLVCYHFGQVYIFIAKKLEIVCVLLALQKSTQMIFMMPECIWRIDINIQGS